MEDAKSKMKSFMKKVNKPFSSTPSAFRGQGRVIGSAPSSSSATSDSIPSRLVPPPRSSAPVAHPPPKRSPAGFDPFESLITSGNRSGSEAPDVASVECPVCCSSFPSEEAVASHIDSCLCSSNDSGVAHLVGEYLAGDPTDGAVEVVVKILRNLVREPGNEKFRRVRMGNPRIKEAIGDARGGLELLECVGFIIREEDGEKWATMEEPTQERIAMMQDVVVLLERSKTKDHAIAVNGTAERSVLMPKNASESQKIDRKARVFFSVPENVAAKIDLPDSFYNLSIEEIRREAESRKKKIAESQLLIPRSYKEKQAMVARKKYKLSVIRVQFPDGVVLQGIFLPWERTAALYEFVSSALKEPMLEFDLMTQAVPRVRLIPRFAGADGRAPTLEEENLVPSALVKFKPHETDSIVFTGLADELLELFEPLTAATTVL